MIAEAFAARLKNKGKKKTGPQHNKLGKCYSSSHMNKYLSKIQCYGFQEYGHFKRDCHNMGNNKKRKGKQHASTTDVEDEKPNKIKSGKDFFYFSALTCSIADDDDIWLEDSGASRHMTREFGNISSMKEKKLSQRVELGENPSYAVKGIGNTSIEL